MKDRMSSRRYIAQHTYGTWRRQTAWQEPLLIQDAEGCYFYDEEGKRYLDFASQVVCSNLGHKNKAVIEAIVRQAEHLPYAAPGFVTEITARALEALTSMLPETLSRFFFSTSGTEANEAALKITRQVNSPRYKIISRYRSYHGATPGSLSITGDPRRILAEQARSTLDGVRFAPDAYCYRCPFDLAYPSCGVQCAKYVDYMIREEGNVAGVIIEPVVGMNGRMVPPPEYLPILEEICRRHGALLIVDEVMSGWFRTGKALAIEHWDVSPDILTLAKGTSGAYTPVGVTVTTERVADFFQEQTFNHGHSFAYHPLTLAAIPAAIGEYKRLQESGRLEIVSRYLETRLLEVGERHPSVGDVRGIGHFWALELVKNRETKEPFNRKQDLFSQKPLMPRRVAEEAKQRGLYLAAWYDTLMIAPPLIITEAEIDDAIEILDAALTLADQEAEATRVPVSQSSDFAG